MTTFVAPHSRRLAHRVTAFAKRLPHLSRPVPCFVTKLGSALAQFGASLPHLCSYFGAPGPERVTGAIIVRMPSVAYGVIAVIGVVAMAFSDQRQSKNGQKNKSDQT